MTLYECVEVSLPFSSMKCGVPLLSRVPISVISQNRNLLVVGNATLKAVTWNSWVFFLLLTTVFLFGPFFFSYTPDHFLIFHIYELVWNTVTIVLAGEGQGWGTEWPRGWVSFLVWQSESLGSIYLGAKADMDPRFPPHCFSLQPIQPRHCLQLCCAVQSCWKMKL